MIDAFVDTDVLIRLLTGDDPGKQRAAALLFASVEQGTTRLHAPDTVIGDAIAVLASPRLYHRPRTELSDALTTLVNLPNIRIANKQIVLRALELYGQRAIDFGDAMIIATMEASPVENLYSYDHDFNNLDGVNRLEPAA